MSNGVTFYQDINYQGRSWAYDGDAVSLADGNDQFSSARIPTGMTVVLYEHANYQGQSLTLTGDAPDLRKFSGPGPGRTWNDVASSVKFQGGGPSEPAERLTLGNDFVECDSAGVITTRATKGNAGRVKITKHDDHHYDATFIDANCTLSIQPNGRLESRPAGTYGGYENLDAITAPDPNPINLLYRVDRGHICGGTVLQIVEE